MVCPSVWIRRLRHYKRSLQEVWPFARIHRFKRWLKSRTRGLAICRQKSGERAREKRSVLLSRFVVFVVGSVRLSRGLSNCRPLVCPLPRRKKACPTVALSNCRLRGFPHDATAGAQTKGLSFCPDSSFSSRVRSAYREVCPIVALWSALSPPTPQKGLSNCRGTHECPTVALSNCRLRGFPHDATAGAQTKGLSFCREPSFSSRVRSAYREVCPIVALWSALSHAAKRPVQLSRHS
ncbi:MAG: hypothetical protein RLZZ179_1945 [Verrucomicrobiota bacterium]|jgi:hypothetical protein